MDQHGPESKVYNAVFVDRYGRRRRAVIGVGLLVAVMLVVWLTLMCGGLVVAMSQPERVGPGDLASAC